MVDRKLPIQMISCCSADGELQPLRFRFEDRAHAMHTASVVCILDIRRMNYVGIESIDFLCKALLEEKETLCELRYCIRSHRWELLREMY